MSNIYPSISEKLAALNLDIYHYDDIVRCYALAKLITETLRGIGYGKRFMSREELVQMIEDYITYYNNCRVQRNLGILTPMKKHYDYPMAA